MALFEGCVVDCSVWMLCVQTLPLCCFCVVSAYVINKAVSAEVGQFESYLAASKAVGYFLELRRMCGGRLSVKTCGCSALPCLVSACNHFLIDCCFN